MPEFLALFREPLDLDVYLSRCHVGWNVRRGPCIPAVTALQTSLVAELRDPIFVEPEVVAELVENGDADLRAKLVRIGERLLERDPVDRDLVGERAGHVLSLRERYAVVQAEEVRVLRVLLLDDHRDVTQSVADM